MAGKANSRCTSQNGSWVVKRAKRDASRCKERLTTVRASSHEQQVRDKGRGVTAGRGPPSGIMVRHTSLHPGSGTRGTRRDKRALLQGDRASQVGGKAQCQSRCRMVGFVGVLAQLGERCGALRAEDGDRGDHLSGGFRYFACVRRRRRSQPSLEEGRMRSPRRYASRGFVNRRALKKCLRNRGCRECSPRVNRVAPEAASIRNVANPGGKGRGSGLDGCRGAWEARKGHEQGRRAEANRRDARGESTIMRRGPGGV